MNSDLGNASQALRITQSRKTIGSGVNTTDRLTHVLNLGGLIRRTRPTMYEEPRLRFSLAAAQRRQGLSKEAVVIIALASWEG